MATISSNAQAPAERTFEDNGLGSVNLNGIFAPVDLSPASPVIKRWTSQEDLTQGLAQELQFGAPIETDSRPVRDAFTTPRRNSPPNHVARIPKKPTVGMLQPISESELEPEPPFRDYLIGTISFQEPTVEPEKPKSKIIELETPQEKKTISPEPEASVVPDDLSPEKLESQIKEQIDLISKEPGEPALKEEQLNQLNTANAWIQKANNFQSLIKSQKEAQKTFEAKLTELQDSLKTPLPSETPDPTSSSEKLQMELQVERQELQQQKMQLSENQRKTEDREKRIAQLPADRAAAQEKLSKTTLLLSELNDQPEGSSKQFSMLILKAQQWAAKKEIESLDTETPRLEETGKLLPLERSRLIRKIENLETKIEIWNAAYNEKRKEEISDQENEAIRLGENAVKNDPRLRAWAGINQKLAKKRTEWTAGIELAQTNLKTVTAQLEEIDASLSKLRKTSEDEVTTAVGISLVEQRHSLIMPWESQAEIQRIRTQLKDNRLKWLEWQEDRQRIPSVESVVKKLLDGHQPTELSNQEFKSRAQQLVESRVSLLDDLNEDYEVYRGELAKEENARIGLIKKIAEMRSFIDEKALWIQSANPIWQDPAGKDTSDLAKSFEGLASLCGPHHWKSFTQPKIIDRFKHRPSESALAGLVLICLFVVSQRLREKS